MRYFKDFFEDVKYYASKAFDVILKGLCIIGDFIGAIVDSYTEEYATNYNFYCFVRKVKEFIAYVMAIVFFLGGTLIAITGNLYGHTTLAVVGFVIYCTFAIVMPLILLND